MRKFTFPFWLVMVAVCVLFLFQVSGEAQSYKKRLTALEKEISQYEEDIRILEADWSYLNRPGRLSKLAARHLQLRALTAENFAAPEQIPETSGGKLPRDAVVVDKKLFFHNTAQLQGGG